MGHFLGICCISIHLHASIFVSISLFIQPVFIEFLHNTDWGYDTVPVFMDVERQDEINELNQMCGRREFPIDYCPCSMLVLRLFHPASQCPTSHTVQVPIFMFTLFSIIISLHFRLLHYAVNTMKTATAICLFICHLLPPSII